VEGADYWRLASAETSQRGPQPGKSDGPLGMFDGKTFQPPLTEDQKRHNEKSGGARGTKRARHEPLGGAEGAGR
jgi:hypothetical protein